MDNEINDNVQTIVTAIINGLPVLAESFDHSPELVELNRRAVELSGGACRHGSVGTTDDDGRHVSRECLWLELTADGMREAAEESDDFSIGDGEGDARPLLNDEGIRVGTAWLGGDELGFDENVDVCVGGSDCGCPNCVDAEDE